MEKIRLNKQSLLETLSQNLINHRDQFEKAIEGYRKEAIKQLDEHIKLLVDGNPIVVQVYLPRPEDHTDDYKRIIMQCNMSVEDEVVLTDKEFQEYVQDDWSWKNAFVATNSRYLDG